MLVDAALTASAAWARAISLLRSVSRSVISVLIELTAESILVFTAVPRLEKILDMLF